MTQQRFFESILYILRYDFRDMPKKFSRLLNYRDGLIAQLTPPLVYVHFEGVDSSICCLDLSCQILDDQYYVTNLDIKRSLYNMLNDYNIIGDDGHLTDLGQGVADSISRIIAQFETDSCPGVQVQYFEITEDGIDEYKNHIEEIRAYLDKKQRSQ